MTTIAWICVVVWCFGLARCWWLLRNYEKENPTTVADPVAVPCAERVAPSFADSALAPAAKVDPGAAVSPGLMRLLQPVTPLDLPPVDPLSTEPQPALSGAVITSKAVETANSAIVYRCELDGMGATPLACYLLGFYKAVEDLRKPPGYVVHVSMGPNPEIVAVFPQEKK